MKRLQEFISKFANQKILVLGDFMLDEFIWGRVDRISPEAPVPVVNVVGESASLGGAGNVVQNLRAMGADVIPFGVVGKDFAGKKIVELLNAQNASSENLVEDNRLTTVKTRILAHQQQVVRVDREEKDLIPESLQKKLADRFLKELDSADGAIISDYSKGCITPNLLEAILPEAKRRKKMICLDPKIRYFSSYTPVTILTPNQNEASVVLGYPIVSEADLQDAGNRILKMIDCEALLITRGEKGMALFYEGQIHFTPARAREVYDVTGAGDTVISILCLALAAGADFHQAVTLTNIAAGIVVGKIGTATLSPDELIASL